MFDFVPRPVIPEAFPPVAINPFVKLAIWILGMLIVLFLVYALIPDPLSGSGRGCT